jgi:endonuclease/exonuclease/phosphatase family metal-dependent hydrolase
MKKITLLSLNCFDISLFRFSSRQPRLSKLIQEIIRLSPDVICLQEITFRDTLRKFRMLLEKSGYYVSTNNTSNQLLNPGGFITASRMPIIRAQFYRYKQQGSWLSLDLFERLSVKGFQHIEIKPQKIDSIHIINTHLHCPFGNFFTTKASNVAVSQYNQIRATYPLTHRTILTGDINYLPNNDLYQKIIGILTDPLYNSDLETISPKNTNRNNWSKSNGRIDYTFISRDMSKTVSQKIVFQHPVKLDNGEYHHLSDHFGVWTDLYL